MKTGEAAKLLGVDTVTIKKWIDRPQLARFFSPSARGQHGSMHRVLIENDILILNTVRHLRSQGMSDWDAIAEYLDSGRREQEFPANAISMDTRTIPMPQAEQAARLAAMMSERDAAIRAASDLRERLVEANEEKERLIQEIRALERRIGYLEGKLDEKGKD